MLLSVEKNGGFDVCRGPIAVGWACLFAVIALVTAGGCWQEVDYNPANRPLRQSSGNDGGDRDGAGSADAGQAVEDDIFGGDDSTGETPVDAMPADAGPTSPVDSGETVVPPSDDASQRPAVTAAERQTAWTLASQWSLAAAMSGRGVPPAQYSQSLAKAGQAAQQLGLVLPELPKPPGEPLAANVAEALRTGAGADLATAIGGRLDARAAAATRLAVVAHALLLVYTPLEADAPALARELRDAVVASQLPGELWQPLVDLVSRRSEYDPVKKAVFTLQKSVADHFAAASTTGP